MKTYFSIGTSMDDLVFSTRNHDYGAYYIRKHYDRNMARSTFIAIVIFVLAFLIPGYIRSLKTEDLVLVIPGEFIVHEFEFNAPVKPSVYYQPNQSQALPQGEIERVVADHEELIPTLISDNNIPTLNGEPISGNSIGLTGTALNDNNSGVFQETLHNTEVVNTEEVFLIAEELPVFGDGKISFPNYLSTHIKIPAFARENDIQGRVIVEFIINKNGEVTHVKLLRGINAIVDEEVLNVIRNMPKWKAGKHRGQSVNIKLIQPVNIKLN